METEPEDLISRLRKAYRSGDLKQISGLHVQQRTIDRKLRQAVREEDIAEAKSLLKKGADPNLLGARDGMNAFHVAVRTGHELLVSLLLDHGAHLSGRTFDEDTALHIAVSEGRVGIAKLLLDKGADPCAPGRWGATPQHLAAEDGHAELVELLAHKGAHAEIRDGRGRTVWNVASPQVRPILEKYQRPPRRERG